MSPLVQGRGLKRERIERLEEVIRRPSCRGVD